MEAKFNISEVLRTSWGALKSQIWILVGLFIGYSILSAVFTLLLIPYASLSYGWIIGNLLFLAISLIFNLGYMKNLFQTLDGEEPQFSAYGQQARKIGTCLIAELIYGILVLVGALLFVIPGIYIYLRLQFFVAFIVEEDAGIIESLKRSWEITDGQTLPLLVFLLTAIIISLVGFIILGVGVFVAYPLIMLMQCYIYRVLCSFT
ncbi:MAG: hypothetical protein LBH58_04225 [Tannerellaceae bacterium]|jgi:uncharacterized membrane protein|nr:hypothetical protein [Tannerellaceae bacterium]